MEKEVSSLVEVLELGENSSVGVLGQEMSSLVVMGQEVSSLV